MNKPNPKKFKKGTVHPLLKDLSDFVKDHANYETIQLSLLDTLASRHSHGEVTEWANCFDCQQKVKDHKNLMIKLGFKDSATYMAWRAVHEAIKTATRVKLEKYNT